VSERLGVVIVGAGQAGLATSHELAQRGVPHVGFPIGPTGDACLG
jgi:putative flavoprotein involved in K+ transport